MGAGRGRKAFGFGRGCPDTDGVRSLGITVSEAPGAVKRAVAAGLLPPGGLGVRPGAEALREFLVHGAKYSFPALRGEMARTDGLFRVSRITNTLPS